MRCQRVLAAPSGVRQCRRQYWEMDQGALGRPRLTHACTAHQIAAHAGRYSEDQIQYHYTHDKALLERCVAQQRREDDERVLKETERKA